MRQKQVKTAPKNAKQINLKKTAPPKKVAAPVEEDDDDEEEEVVVAVKKPGNKKAAMVQKKVSPSKKVAAPVEEEKKVVAKKVVATKKAVPVQKKVVQVVEEPEEEEDDEVEEEEDDEVEEEEDDDVEEEEEVEADEDQEGEEEEAIEEDDDEQDDEVEEEDVEEDDEDAEEEQEENDEDDDDEGPTEAPIDEEPTLPSKVKSGEIPDTVPLNRIVHITKLPKKCKKIDIVEAFAKFGAIDQIHLVTTPTGTVANVAFKTPKAAEAATAVSRKIKVIGSPVEVSAKKPRKEKKEYLTDKFDVKENRDRTIYVKYLRLNTTEDQIREHFAACGEIQRCKVITKNRTVFSYVTFPDTECVKTALKLHNTVLNGGTIAVYQCMPDKIIQLGQRDRNLIVMLRNKQQLDALEGATIEKIFSKCGQIEHMEVLCGKNILAFIVFKTEQAAEKALKLSGKTEEGIELEVEKYDGYRRKTAIHVANLTPDCTVEDLKNHFSVSGEIKSIIRRKGFAIIYFEDSDGYCKSFLLDESYLNKQMIFVEPLSSRKQNLVKARMAKIFETSKMGNRKRPFQNGNSVFKGKKPRME